MHTDNPNHWKEHSKQWDQLSSPLRPNDDDMLIYQKFLNDNDKALILGVTPELVVLADDSICVDLCKERIDLLWDINKTAIQADWLNLPFDKNQFDVVFGDGVFTQFTYPEQCVELVDSVSSQLKHNGKFVTRIFVNNEDELLESIGVLAVTGAIGSFHAFKWRFVMALLNERSQVNIPVTDILENFNRNFPDREYLSNRSGWSIESINTIDVYKDSPAVYSFPTLHQLEAIRPDEFIIETIECGKYELSECCPIVVWKKIK